MEAESDEIMLASLLPFQQRIARELIEEDGLCILSAGMGWQKIVSFSSFALKWRKQVPFPPPPACIASRQQLQSPFAGGSARATATGTTQKA